MGLASIVLKFLFVTAIVFFLFRLIRRDIDNRRPANKAAANPPIEEDMVRCASCGIYFPRAETCLLDGKHYCCAAHRGQQPRRGSVQ
jgi:uncharacterized protein